MLDEGCVRLLASDAHDTTQRPQNLAAGYECAAKRVGVEEAQRLVLTRPMGVLRISLPGPLRGADAEAGTSPTEAEQSGEHATFIRGHVGDLRGWSGRLRGLLQRQSGK